MNTEVGGNLCPKCRHVVSFNLIYRNGSLVGIYCPQCETRFDVATYRRLKRKRRK